MKIEDIKMPKGKNVLTTGDVAKICNVAPRTVSKWFDKGQLKGYRIPGSKDRRIPLSELVRFMKQHNMPTDNLAFGTIRVLIVDTNEQSSSRLAEQLHQKTDYTIETVNTEFETGLKAQKMTPHVMLINLMSEGINAGQICRNIHSNEDLKAVKIIAVTNLLKESEKNALLEKGFDDCIEEPSDIITVIRKIEKATSIIQ
jgi:excisionase family DNA binding protein